MSALVKTQGVDGTILWVGARGVCFLLAVPDAEVLALGGVPPWTRLELVTGIATNAWDVGHNASEINSQGGQNYMVQLPNVDPANPDLWVGAVNILFLEPVPAAEVLALGGVPPWTRIFFAGGGCAVCALSEDDTAAAINGGGPPP